METLGSDFNTTGSVMNRSELEELRKRRGECLRCGRKCFQKKLFKLIPITEEGYVLEGRCLNCLPLNGGSPKATPGVPRRATPEDLERFTRSQSNLANSSRNLMMGGSSGGASPIGNMPLGRRHNMSRAASSLPRTDYFSSSPGPQHADFRRATSVSPFGGGSREASLSPPRPSRPRPIPALNHTNGGGGGGGGGGTTTFNSNQSSSGSGAAVAAESLSTSTGHRSADDLGFMDDLGFTAGVPNSNGSPPPARLSGSIASAPPTGRAIKRRSSHSDVLNGGDASEVSSRSSLLRSTRSGDLPTREELQRAQETIWAARQHGIYDVFESSQEAILPHNNDDSLEIPPDINSDNADDSDFEAAAQVSRDFEIAIEASQRDILKLSQEEQEERDFQEALQASSRDVFMSPHAMDGFASPQRMLNRGGSFPLSPDSMPIFPPIHHSSSGSSLLEENAPRTMSGINEDFAGGAETSVNRGHTERIDIQSPPLFSASVPKEASASERKLLDDLNRAGDNYGEILITLREGFESVLVVAMGLEQLSRLKFSPQDQHMLVEMGLLLVVTDVMRSHPSSKPVQVAACGAIWNMSSTTRNQVAFVKCEALDAILAAMDRFDNVELQEKAISALSNLCAAEANLSILEEKGAVSRIVKAMNEYSEVSSIQVKGCGALTNIASHDVPMKERMVESGIGGAVVVAMVMHPNDPFVQEKALRALRSLCANSDRNKVELANVGGIDSVISAMQVHRDEPGVQEQGAWTLSTFAGNEVSKIVIGDCGGVDVVIRAMWVHALKVSVLEWCCRALYTLTLDPQNCRVVLDVGGISAIVNSMQGHVDCQTVQEMGCAIFGNLAANDDETRMRIVDEEALDAIVLAMVLHADDMQVQERACVALMRLAVPSNYNAMKAANIPELVRTAARKFPDRCDEPAQQLLSVF